MYEALLQQIESEMSRQELQPPCSCDDLELLKKRAMEELGVAIPAGYDRFLATTNGLAWNGLFLYASETTPMVGFPDQNVPGFIEANREFRTLRASDPMNEYLVFGEDSVALFTYHIKKGVYEVITSVGMTVLESFGNCDELLVDALQGHV